MKRLVLIVALVLAAAHVHAADVEPESAEALMDRARESFRSTRYDDALAQLEAAVAAFSARDDAPGAAEARLEIGLVLLEAGAMRRGLEIIDDVVTSLPDDADAQLAAHALVRLARGRRTTGDLHGAGLALDRAERLFDLRVDVDGQSKVWAERSSIATANERWPDAAAYAQRARALATEPGLQLDALARLSYALHHGDRLPEAEVAYRDVLAMSKAQHDLRLVNFAYCNLADVQWRAGDTRPALAGLWRALDGIEQARSRIAGTPEERTAYLARQVAVYDRLIRFLVDTSDSRTAFNVAERFRARSFLEMLGARDRAHTDTDFSTQHAATVAALGAARLALQSRTRSAERATMRHDVERLELELDRLRAGHAGTERESIPIPTGVDLGDISSLQAAIADDEVLLAYWVSDERTLVWVIGKQERILFQVPLTRAELRATIDRYLEPMRFPRRAEDFAIRGREREHLATGHALYRWLIEPMPDWAHAAARLVILPDAELHRLPFESLVRACDPAPAPDDDRSARVHDAYAQCRYLGLEKAIVYSPSAGTLMAIRKRAAARRATSGPSTEAVGSLLAMAPTFEAPAEQAARVLPAELRALHLRGLAPLAHTRDEVERIATHVPKALSLVGDAASERRFKRDASAFRFLHLATHGLVDDALPMSSGVLLDHGDGEDGLLQANEILDLRLGADLVTVSACRSGRGRLERGQGIVGLSRAFLFAGASAVAVTRWDVDDRSTPLMMDAFYQAVAAGDRYDEALRRARVALFDRDGRTRLVRKERAVSYAHPRFWAGFMMIGEPAQGTSDP